MTNKKIVSYFTEPWKVKLLKQFKFLRLNVRVFKAQSVRMGSWFTSVTFLDSSITISVNIEVIERLPSMTVQFSSPLIWLMEYILIESQTIGKKQTLRFEKRLKDVFE